MNSINYIKKTKIPKQILIYKFKFLFRKLFKLVII